MDRKVGRLDKYVGPNAGHQFLFTHQLTWAFKQHREDFQSTTSERHWPFVFQEKKLRGEQAKGSERNFDWRGADRFGACREESLVCIRSLKFASHVKCLIGVKLCQR